MPPAGAPSVPAFVDIEESMVIGRRDIHPVALATDVQRRDHARGIRPPDVENHQAVVAVGGVYEALGMDQRAVGATEISLSAWREAHRNSRLRLANIHHPQAAQRVVADIGVAVGRGDGPGVDGRPPQGRAARLPRAAQIKAPQAAPLFCHKEPFVGAGQPAALDAPNGVCLGRGGGRGEVEQPQMTVVTVAARRRTLDQATEHGQPCAGEVHGPKPFVGQLQPVCRHERGEIAKIDDHEPATHRLEDLLRPLAGADIADIRGDG